MITIDQVPQNTESTFMVVPSDFTRHEISAPISQDVPFLNNKLLGTFRVSLMIGGILIASGLYHLAILWVTGADWSGPLSPRKPGLFGVSAGLTVWSIAWILTQLVPRRNDQLLANLMSFGLLLEVALITLQQWRGVPSHFNRTTALDATIESTMLGLILLVTAGIAWLCIRSRHLLAMPESRAIAIRAGLWLLLVSCGLGLLITITGQINLAAGRSPETWGKAGVLKYPHGAALHAIQALPVLSLLLQRWGVSHSVRLLRIAVASQVLFLTHALWQTFSGRTRFDIDLTGIAALAVAGMLIILFLKRKQFARSKNLYFDEIRPTLRDPAESPKAGHAHAKQE